MSTSTRPIPTGGALRQAALLREGQLDASDIENLAEEIQGLGKREKREIGSRFTVPLLHLLKWACQPKRRGSSWEAAIWT